MRELPPGIPPTSRKIDPGMLPRSIRTAAPGMVTDLPAPAHEPPGRP
ncbi:MAG: hypothetical protein KIT69_08845 [Propionibacteriaceae bacterium]|nr:hypothetical protein [Propionibacteriaceae bacterium]